MALAAEAESLPAAELRERAAELGIDVTSASTKAEVIEVVQAPNPSGEA